jgi:dTDP-4-amino-4,6-dideoxy-D-galactose acyltransferase
MVDDTDLCEELPWDSAFFGVSIARARTPHLDEMSCRAMLEWCRRRRIDCLYFLCPFDDAATQRLLTDHAFQLVGVKVTLSRSPGPDSGHESGQCRPATVDDIPRLRAIALASHRDTRFHADGHFDAARCDELYATWIENSVRGYATHVIVAVRDSSAIGYITLHIDRHDAGHTSARTARIGLFAVDEQWRGQGAGRDLLRCAAQILHEQGVGDTSVVTPGRNTGAQKLYKSAGFRTTDVSLWYHRWSGDGRR